jgi:membrane-associated phospholipid phosphatase
MRPPVVDYRELRLSRLTEPRFVHLWLLLDWVGFLILYSLTENLIPPEKCHVMHCFLDDLTPFCEWFILPYCAWFLLIVFSLGYFLLYHIDSFRRLQIFIMITQIVAMAVYILYPSRQDLRPAVMPRDNVFTHLTAMLYRGDTSTNVFPSIHVYNSMACAFAAVNTRTLNNHRIWRFFWIVMATLVILSTTFLKQHSVMDVSAALLMSMLVYIYVYRKNEVAAPVPAGHLGRVDFS